MNRLEKNFSMISAICLALWGLYTVILRIADPFNNIGTNSIYIIIGLIHIVAAVFIFMRNKQVILVVLSGASGILYYALYALTALDFSNLKSNFLSTCLNYITLTLVYIALTLVFLFNSIKKTSRITKYIWFIPAAIFLILVIVKCSSSNSAPYILSRLVKFAGLVFAGLWLKEGNASPSMVNVQDKKIPEDYKSSPVEKPSTIIQQSSSVVELKKFKELLDMGAITQEEYDAKKKQILGL